MDCAKKGALDACLKCSICVTQCPVAKATEKFPGPKFMGTELTRFRLDQNTNLDQVVDYCCNCRSCEVACPSGVKISYLNAVYKDKYKEKHGKKLRDRLLGRPELLAKLGSINASLSNSVLKLQPVKKLMEKTLGTAASRAFPSYHNQNFKTWFKKRKKIASEKKVVYFVGCFTNYNDLETGKNVVEVLERNGFEVIVPEQTCCGLPLIGNGEISAAKSKAQKNLEKFMPYVKKGYPVIVSCTSCSLTLKSEYHECFNLEESERFGQNVYDFSEFLRDLAVKKQLDTNFGSLPLKLAYHTPCHLKAQGIGQPSVEIMEMIPNLKIEEIDEGCCGLSGSYGFKKEKAEISMKIGEKLFKGIREAKPDFGTTDCGGCGLQMLHGTGISVLHPAKIINMAYKNNLSKNNTV